MIIGEIKMNNDFKDIMQNRKSIRQFDTTAKISRDELIDMLNEATSAPSACNLQSWHFVIVDTPEGKEKLHHFFMPFNFRQTDTASAIVMVFGNTKSYLKYRDLWNGMVEAKKVTPEARDAALNTFLPLYEKADRTMLIGDAMVDSALVSMQFMLVAREHGYETNAMAGYDSSKAASEFGLDPQQYVPVMAIAIGKPDPSETVPDTVRYDIHDLTDFA